MEGYYNSLFSVNVVVVPLGKRGKGPGGTQGRAAV